MDRRHRYSRHACAASHLLYVARAHAREIYDSGIKILRFDVIERFVHWLTGVSFVIFGITGLNITFGLNPATAIDVATGIQ